MIPIETERLVLRHLAPGDAPFILRLLNEPSFLEHIGDKGVRSLEQAEGYLQEGPMASYRRHGHGLYRVELKATGEPIGMCGLLKRDAFEHPDLGYAFLPEHWGRGYALEAGGAVLAWEPRPRTLAVVSPGNAPSIRLLEKLGFLKTGTAQMYPNEPEVLVYELALVQG